MEPREQFVVANGLSHRVLVWNEEGAETIVLGHGFLDLAWSFAGVAARLAAAGLRVVAFDWRGHGKTEHVGAGGYYHFADYVLDLHALMPQLVRGPAHLCGHSMGATAVALYAGTHPGTLATLTLIEGLGPPESSTDAPTKMRAWLDSMDRLAQKPPRAMKDLADAVQRLRVTNTELPIDVAYRIADEGTRAADDGDGLVWRFDPKHRTTSPGVFSAEVFCAFLARVDCPTRVISGGRGFRTSDHEARLARLPRADEVVIPDVGHMLHQQAPEALADAILAHVRGLGRGADEE